ncbi:MAG: hypothetical protein COB79_03610 [Zetaproteobacteria bacterium]|nr:MAG: hypothetical protein COB79_03610 [Zetaproteobacteria bacterium]
MFAYKQLHNTYKDIVFSAPSGNFGNVCAGMIAQQLGLPIKHFIASNNENNVVTRYLKTELYSTKPSVQTISNAMDVGDPSNFVRIQEIYKNDFKLLKDNLSSYSFSDEETRAAMKEIYGNYNYVADPHGAVGYLGAKAYLKSNPKAHCVFLETAHPSKFLDVVEDVIKEVELYYKTDLAVDKPRKLRIQIKGELYSVFANHGSLVKMLKHLLHNAVDATQENGTILISSKNVVLLNKKTGLNTKHVLIAVEDHGHGMDTETQHKIFEPFFSTRFAGRGMSLPQVLKTIKKHNGQIRIKTGVGKGSIFKVYLPALD